VGAFSAVWVGFVIVGSLQEPPGTLLFLLIALLPLAYLFVVTEVTLADDGTREFRSVMRRRRIRVHRITAIRSDEEAIYVHYEHGKKIQLWERTTSTTCSHASSNSTPRSS
jgi:hypothetical protein